MIDTMQIKQMSKIEKLQTMEFLWKDLSNEASSLTSPSWHKKLLDETESRFKKGLEVPVDWSIAKRKLRNEFE